MGSELFHRREIRILPAVMAGLIYCAWFLLAGGTSDMSSKRANLGEEGISDLTVLHILSY